MLSLDTLELIAKYEDLTDEQWVDLRKTGIGGSDCAGALGLSKYSSPLQICMIKTGRTQPADLSDNESVWFGSWIEKHIRADLVAPYLKEKLGIDAEVIDPVAMWRSKLFPWMIVNSDGWLKIDGEIYGLEIKTGGSYAVNDWGGVNGSAIPDSYFCQVQHYLAATDLKKWYVFGVIGGNRILRVIERNEEFILDLIERERELWEIIEKNDPFEFPLASALDCDKEIVLNWKNNGEPAEIDDLFCFEYLRAVEQEKREKLKKEELKNRIIQSLNGNDFGKSDKYTVEIKRGKSIRFTVKEVHL